MATYVKDIVVVNRVRETAARVGIWVSLLTAVAAIVSFTIAILTPPRSGPFCTGPCIAYPYSGAAAFYPRDFLWIFPAILLALLFLFLCTCFDFWVGIERKLFSRMALILATISTAIITLDYFIQLEVMQPSLLKGETDGLALFSLYNPHGMFIALEDLGYLMMSLVFCFFGAALAGMSGLEKSIRRVLMAGSMLGIAAFVGATLLLGTNVETRFEVAIVAMNWVILAVAGILLSVLFRRTLQNPAA